MRFVFVLALLAAVAACGNAKPCTGTECPPLAGTYAMAWSAGSQNGCSTAGPQPATLTFTLTGNVVTTTVGGLELRGSAYDTYDFTATGGRSEVGFSLRGTVVPTNPKTDAGVRIVGSMATRRYDGGTDCEVRENFTGDRISN